MEDKGIKRTWFTEKLGESFNMANVYVQNRHLNSFKILSTAAELLKISGKDLLVDCPTNN